MEQKQQPGSIETAPERKFSDLNPAEKVTALLAMAQEPVDKDWALHLANIDLDKLTDEEMQAIEAAFSIAKVKPGFYKREEGGELIKQMSLDPGDVENVIGDFYLKRFYDIEDKL